MEFLNVVLEWVGNGMNEKIDPIERGDIIRADWLNQIVDRVNQHDVVGPSTDLEQLRAGGIQGITQHKREILVLAEMIRHIVKPSHAAYTNRDFNVISEAARVLAGDRSFDDFVAIGQLIDVVTWDLPLIEGQRYVFRYEPGWNAWIPTAIRLTEVVRTLSAVPSANGYIDALIQYYDDENQIWLDGPAVWVIDANTDVAGVESFRSFTAIIGDGSTTSFTITHNLGSQDLNVTVRRNVSPFDLVSPDVITFDNVSQITVTFSAAPDSNGYRVIIEKPG